MGRKRGHGVINITTRDAGDTQGTLLIATSGTEERGRAAARYGGKLGDSGFFRVFGQYSERDATFHPSATTSDDWRIGYAGFRADWDANSSDTLTLQGDCIAPTSASSLPRSTSSGARADRQSRSPCHRRQRAGAGGISSRPAGPALRAYFDRTHRNDPSFHDDLDTVDVELQLRYLPFARHESCGA